MRLDGQPGLLGGVLDVQIQKLLQVHSGGRLVGFLAKGFLGLGIDG